MWYGPRRAVRITHLPTGVVAEARDDDRNAPYMRRRAMQMLRLALRRFHGEHGCERLVRTYEVDGVSPVDSDFGRFVSAELTAHQ